MLYEVITQVDSEQDQAADETPLLGEHGEGEVGVPFGEKGELRLGPLHEALAEKAAAADGDFRLDDVVAAAERVALGVEEGANPSYNFV